MKTILFLAAAASAFVAGPASAQGQSQDQEQWNLNNPQRQACVRIGEIYGWQPVNDRTLIIRNNRQQKFKVDLVGICPGLRFKLGIGVRSFGGSELSCVSPGDDIFFHDTGMTMRCSIAKVAAYTPQMEKADKDAAAKKDSK